MSHRIEQKAARRAERLRREAERLEARQRARRRASYASVAVLAAVIVTLALVLSDGSPPPAGDHAPNHGTASAKRAGGSYAVGDKAPAFRLTDAVSGGQVTSASLRGRTSMLFFSEGVNCQACMVQAADLERAGTLRKAGIRLLSVSTDPLQVLAAAVRDYGIRTPFLADPSTEMSRAYGMLGHGGMGHPDTDGHAFMLVDEKGTVLWHRAYQEMYVEPGELMRDMRAEMRRS